MSEAALNPLGLYVHWPFCARICPYCDFNVYRDRGVDADTWSSAFLAELDYWATRMERRPLTSVYFGGGTPSLAPVRVIEAVVNRAAALFGFAPDIEVTLEANPTDAEAERFASLAAIGVTRLSLGVQSLRDDALRFLGRNHDSAAARAAIAAAQSHFPRMNFDLIYGRPGQTIDDWCTELSEALAFRPGHLSLYQLTIEPGTAFHKAVEAGRWTPIDDEEEARFFDCAADVAGAAGLRGYEISNFCRPGDASAHNLIYWRYQDYIGVGPGAHGRVCVNGERIATRALANPRDYLTQTQARGHGLDVQDPLDADAQLMERLSMGLRLAEGVTLYADDYFYRDDTRAENLTRLIEDGFLLHECGTLRTTPAGRRLLNRVLYELLG